MSMEGVLGQEVAVLPGNTSDGGKIGRGGSILNT